MCLKLCFFILDNVFDVSYSFSVMMSHIVNNWGMKFPLALAINAFKLMTSAKLCGGHFFLIPSWPLNIFFLNIIKRVSTEA